MKVLVVGGGGREHALAWKLAQSPRVGTVLVAPGNAGTAREPGVANVPIEAGDIDGLLALARRERVDLAVIGPEAPLVGGIVDAFEAAGLRCFGPSRAGAELEGSKAFTKAFLARHGIATAACGVFETLAEAAAFIETLAPPVVVKADGLAAGKGVVIAGDHAAAVSAARDMLENECFGAAGRRVVVEEFLRGEEVSFIVVTDGEHVLPLASSQDHKARDDGDRGPNTGGMGAYSPAPLVTPQLHRRIMAQVIEPTVAGLRAEGRSYRGFLYAGLMVGADGVPRVLEYNCRFGDPEAQPILMRLRSDLAQLCLAALEGRLAEHRVAWDPRAALAVVLAAGGYPGTYSRGTPIEGVDAGAPGGDVKVFHAGTALRDGTLVTDGGRVLSVCALGDGVGAARERAYEHAARIRFDGMHYRRDIGHRAIARERAPRPAG